MELNCPCCISCSIIEYLVRNRFAKMNRNGLVFLFKHFVGQKKHFNINFYPQFLSPVRKVVKKIGVSAFNPHRYYIFFILFGLGNKAFFPGKVHNAFIGLPARYKACREYRYCHIRFIYLLYMLQHFAAVMPINVNRNKYGLHVFKCKQQLIYKVLYIRAYTRYGANYSKAIQSAQGMIACKNITAFCGYIFYSIYHYSNTHSF